MRIFRETTMLTRAQMDRRGDKRVSTVLATVAVVCVLGLAASLMLHYGSSATEEPAMSNVAPDSRDFLLAPTRDPSVPRADSVFSASSPPDDTPPAPTF
jgi:hypothetical protein